MSLGYGLKGILGVSRLASRVASNCRKACGEHDVLTRDVASLHAVLRRGEDQATKPESLLGRQDDSRKEDIIISIEGCSKALSILDNILEKYNALSEDKRAGKRLWTKIKFGNGEILDLSELRVKISTYTSAITLQLNLISMSSQGRVEREIGNALPEIRESLNWIAAKLSTGNEGSILTSYSGDDKGVWKELRRELILEGFASLHIRQYKAMIMDYIKELGERGLLDDPGQHDIVDGNLDDGQASGEKQETIEELSESSGTTGAPSPSDVESVNRPAVFRAAEVLPVRDINLKRDFIGLARRKAARENYQWPMENENRSNRYGPAFPRKSGQTRWHFEEVTTERSWVEIQDQESDISDYEVGMTEAAIGTSAK
jgi:hypothetical protein